MLTFLFLLYHFGCFAFSSAHRRRRLFKKKPPPPPRKSFFSLIKNIFSSDAADRAHISQPIHSIPSPSSSTRSLRLNPLAGTDDADQVAIFSGNLNLHPCPFCGEIFPTPTLLDHHQSAKHAVAELADGENIVRIIFRTGWPEKAKIPTIHRILKVHNSPQTVARFEEYRESVKLRAAAAAANLKILRDQRSIADGNELLRFCCTTVVCSLDSGVCRHQYCSACGIIRAGFSGKMDADGIATLPTSWTAHAAVPEDLEEEFSFMKIKRALLVCRVIAGRVGCYPGAAEFDSLEGRRGGAASGDGELLVFNPRAVLPCFVIVYTV
ncbi:uncharacterized protein LOC127266281 [Andrographis paniculata]|uniref:uncharacterized protein LOC127266281 n=1 Tax=Andrographis paniculata TaxID=175694 RepID=UPI0021E99273|nr:uncharacterized protein LOC127266281 [Andrographis paniculata]